MTGALQMLFAGGGAAGGIVSPLDVPLISYSNIYNPVTAEVTLNSNGTISSITGAGPYWYSPATASIGNNYWARMSVNSGTAPGTGLIDTIYQLSSNRRWAWDRSAVGTTSANVTLSIASDSGMSTIVSTGTFNVTATVDNGVFISNLVIGDTETGTNASAGLTFVGNSSITLEGNGSSVGNPYWYGPDHPAGIGASYWVRATNYNAPALTVGSYNTWHAIGAGGGQQFRWEQTSVGHSVGTFRFDLSTDSGGATIVCSTNPIPVDITKN